MVKFHSLIFNTPLPRNPGVENLDVFQSFLLPRFRAKMGSALDNSDVLRENQPMNQVAPKPGNVTARRRPRLLGIVALVLLAPVLLFLLVQKSLLSHLVREGIVRAAPLAQIEVVDLEVEVSLGHPIRLRNVELRSLPGAGRTALKIGELVLSPVSLRTLLGSQERLLGGLALDGIDGVLDLRPYAGPAEPARHFHPVDASRNFNRILRFLPLLLQMQIDDLALIGDDWKIQLIETSLSLMENKKSSLSWSGLFLQTPDWSFLFPPSEAVTAWKNGIVYLGDWALLPALHINSLSLELFQPGLILLEVNAASFGGWARANLQLNVNDEANPLDLTLWAGQLKVPEVASLLAPETAEQTSGQIDSLRVSFQGNPDELTAGETTVRLLASEVSWQNRGWQDLVVGLRSASGRASISEFLLQQEGNRIEASGEFLWPKEKNFFDPAALEGRIRSTAQIENLASLARLAGERFAGLSGSLQMETNLEWKKGAASGRFEVSGADWAWGGRSFGGGTVRAVLQGEELQIEELAWQNEKDFLRGGGHVRLSEPFVYAGQAGASIADIALYLPLLPAENFPPVQGSLQLQWQGDGTSKTHSGAWKLDLEEVKLPEFPGGLTGAFAGSYSPENLFSTCRLEHGKLELSWNLTAGRGGVYADKIFLRSGASPLLDGSIYLPWDPLVLLRGESWTEGLLGENNIYAELRSRRLELRDIALLFGQELPVASMVSGEISASGPLESPEFAGSLEFGRLRTTEKEPVQLLDSGKVSWKARDGRAQTAGRFVVPQVEPVLLEAEFPFGMSVSEEGIKWTDPMGELRGKISLPSVNLSQFAKILPETRRLEGVLAGEILLGRSLADPSIDGVITLRNGRLEINRHSPPFTNLRLTARFDGNSMRLEDTGGEVGAGPFRISGGASWQDPSNPEFDLRLDGEQVLLYRDRAMRLRADTELTLRGGFAGGRVAGAVRLVDSRIFQRLEITPLLQGSGPETVSPLLLPDLAGLVPPPFADWQLDLTVENKTPFLLVGNLAAGSIEPNLRIIGSLGDPRPTGRVTLRDLRAFLPFATVTIPEGQVNFQEDKPRSPNLDVRGFSQVMEYDIQLLMQGPLEEQNLVLRSDPPLSQEQILLLITAGIAPGSSTGPGLGQAALGQGSLLVLKALARNFEPDGVDLDSIINRIQVVSAPPPLPGMRSTMRGEFRFTDNAAIYSERDGLGFLGGGLTYRIRFR